MVYTSRTLVVGKDDESALSIGRQVSEGLVEIVRSLRVRPRYIVAKGGITSSDIATQALNVTRARVLGQVLPGVPVGIVSEVLQGPAETIGINPAREMPKTCRLCVGDGRGMTSRFLTP